MRRRPAEPALQLELPHLLVASGDEQLRNDLRSSLESVCSVEEAEDARFALAQAVASAPQVIVISQELAGFDGLTLCSLLRRDRKMKMARIAVIGSEESEFVCRAKAAGADRVLSATIGVPLMRAEIEELLATPVQESWTTSLPLRTPGRRRSEPPRTSVTDRPPRRPPTLVCPRCDASLMYVSSYVGGIETFEQWDTFKCSKGCGTFQYRHRNKSLRPAESR